MMYLIEIYYEDGHVNKFMTKDPKMVDFAVESFKYDDCVDDLHLSFIKEIK